MRYRLDFPGARAVFALAVFAVLAAAILTRPPKWLGDFDQSFYLTIAYDIERHGVFSNGAFDDVDSTRAMPPPGTFFAPAYPLLVAATAKLDPRFAQAVRCVVETNHERREVRECAVYARPMHLIHALLLAIGVLAIARAAELIFPGRGVFFIAGALATTALVAEANLFSFVMTESLVFSLYSVTALALVLAWTAPTTAARLRRGALAGLLLGLLCLTRTAYVVLAPAALALFFAQGFVARRRPAWREAAAFAVCFAVVVLPWAARNQISVGKFTLSEEYGSASLVERFAFNTMTVSEFALAFPYCVPAVGAPVVAALAGTQAMSRFEFDKPGSFFQTGREKRKSLLAIHKRLDPVIGTIALAEMRANWWRHLAASAPLAWCGLWAGGIVGLLLAPAFAVGAYRALRGGTPLFLFYAAPGLLMLALHAAVANHYTRYNIILIGPFAAAAADLIAAAWARRHPPAQSPTHAPMS